MITQNDPSNSALHSATDSSDDFDVLIEQAKAHFASVCQQYGPALFTTNVGDADEKNLDPIYLDYLNNLTNEDYQEHKCNCCHQFIRKYGNLVAIDETGKTISAVWSLTDETPAMYRDSIAVMQKHVESSKIDGVFLTEDKVWGTPVSRGITGGWRHFSITPDAKNQIYKADELDGLSAYEAMALKQEHNKSLSAALALFKIDIVKQALNLLESKALDRPEKAIGVVAWLKKVHETLDGIKSQAYRKNLIWKFVAAAPSGFCTPRGLIAGMLMQDIIDGLPFDAIKKRFNKQMEGDKYMHPTTVKDGNIAKAEKLTVKHGWEPSFERRYATFEEIEKIWVPTNVAPTENKDQKRPVFGHLSATNKKLTPEVKPTTATVITFDKFARTILPKAQKIEFYAPNQKMNFMALTTAVHADAPPIFQWDNEHARNPFAKYVYLNGSYPSTWGLSVNTWIPVTAITNFPHQWGENGDKYTNFEAGIIFILDGAKDINSQGLALFPESLKSSLFSIRSTIEAFSEKGQIQGVEQASACGIAISSGNTAETLKVRVTTENGVALYNLDRFD